MQTTPQQSVIDSPDELQPFTLIFERICRELPDSLAILSSSGNLSYDQLNRSANRIAHKLTEQDVVTGDCIGVCLDRSAEAIAAMLGILKSGAAFVPLDPDYPSERLHFMLEDAGIKTFITQQNYLQQFDGLNSHALLIESDFPDSLPDSNLDLPIHPSDLAYIMYTSGSTGNPKGVQIEHASLTCYCLADIHAYQVRRDDCTIQFSTLNFDISIEEIFPPLMIGSRIAIRPQTRSSSSNELSDLIQKFDVTAVHIATAYWHEWIDLMLVSGDKVPDSIRLMVVTGEKVSVSHYHKWLSLISHDTLWANAYGPTEATVSATVFIPPKDWAGDAMPIGTALKGYTTLILDEHLKPVSQGVTGELHIGGPALSRGYLNRPDLTENVFIDWRHSESPQRLYKTGDLARFLPNGDIDFAGRIDHQIKIGSYRVEPGEIEENINMHVSVLESLVIGDETGGKKRIVAYVATGTATPEIVELNDFLEQRLPIYMIPSAYVLLERFPKTINGKIDRKALPAPDYSLASNSSGKIAPRTETEKKIADIWSELIGHTRIGIEDNFFAAGGQSILAMRFIILIKETFSIDLPVMAVVSSDLRQIALLINPDDKADDDTIRKDRIKPLFFGTPESSLYGVLHSPETVTEKLPIVICQPTGHEYMRTHRSLRILATELARRGYPVLRFDYFGCGDSDGILSHATIERWHDDIREAARFAMETCSKPGIHLLGVRLGGSLAIGADIQTSKKTILWDPVTDGEEHLTTLRKLNHFALSDLDRFRWMQPNENNAEILGYEYSPDLLEEISLLSKNTVNNQLNHSTKVVLSGTNNTPKDLERWFDSETSYKSALIRVEDTQHWENPVYLNDILLAYPVINAIVAEFE